MILTSLRLQQSVWTWNVPPSKKEKETNRPQDVWRGEPLQRCFLCYCPFCSWGRPQDARAGSFLLWSQEAFLLAQWTVFWFGKSHNLCVAILWLISPSLALSRIYVLLLRKLLFQNFCWNLEHHRKSRVEFFFEMFWKFLSISLSGKKQQIP